MNFYTIHTGNFKLDGGAMFGVVPKSLWSKQVPADPNNLCTWAMRCLLVENGNRLLLIDTGIGNKQSEKFFSHYHLHGDTTLDSELRRHGFHRSDITDVLLTHLHFDHVGGAVERTADGKLRPAFPNAVFWSSQRHWDWAVYPNSREQASFLAENMKPLEESGQLKFIPRNGRWERNAFGAAFPGLDIFFADGHTESQMIPVVPFGQTKLAYMADLTPAAAHIQMAWVIGYDTRPLLTMEEKGLLLAEALKDEWVLFFEHDASHACCTLQMTDRGIRAHELAPTLEQWSGI